MWGQDLPFLCSLISCLLLSCFPSATSVRYPDGCSQVSCGQLDNIRWPFGLIGSSESTCRNPVLPLLCISNTTVLDLHSSRYHVTEISYENKSIKIQDPGLADGSCVLPGRSLSYRTFDPNGPYTVNQTTTTWVTFVNCTREIKDQMYVQLPCLSQKSIHVYALSDQFAYQLDFLQPSCRFMAMLPVPNSISPRSQEDVFQILQKGFTLSWNDGSGSLTSYKIIQRCFLESFSSNSSILSLPSTLPQKETHFLLCVQDYINVGIEHGKDFRSAGWMALVMVLLIEAVRISIVLLILGRFIFAPIVICIFIAHRLYRMRKIVDTVEKFLQNQQALASTRYSYTDIIAMTSHFRDKLGQGGFGSVFKGNLAGRLVAVKMLGSSKCNGDDFISEVSTIGRIHHVNVVQLVGFCAEGSKRALVYEYMPNGSLDKYIFSDRKVRPFTEEKLNEIAIGVARGIDYLHRGCDMRILHFDIKPHNILLDHNFNPKVSDFGLAKLYPKGYSSVSFGAARGTVGYIAPELISRSFGIISYKSDVYSFGMLLMEMAGGRRNVNPQAENSSQEYYPSWIYDQLSKEEAPEFNNNIEIGDAERRLCKVGLWCIQVKPADRPSMSKVVEMLGFDVSDLQLPPKPFSSSTETRMVTLSYLDSYSTDLSTISEYTTTTSSSTTKPLSQTILEYE